MGRETQMRGSRPKTAGQLGEFRRKMESIARRAAEACNELESVSDHDALSRLIDRIGEYETPILRAAIEKTESILKCDRYVDEEVVSDREYPPTFKGPKPLEEQIKILADIFKLSSGPALEYAKKLPEQPTEARAEGWYAIPALHALINKYWPGKSLAAGYCLATNMVLQKLGETRPFFNNREGQVAEKHFRREKYSKEKLLNLAEKQRGNNILIVAAQFGKRHRGRSVLRALESFSPYEYGLGAFEVGCMALTHPERFSCEEEVDADCCGDEVALKVGDDYRSAPCFIYRANKLQFDVLLAGGSGTTFGHCGAVSGFMPED